ncbi:glycosyltransferase [Candidatus Formimonas warabiya]|uniref:Glycosyl transferase n=1 Tax=Formimonas warabiya TaxID=1761012 RepID=A0A3G1KST0_FORW1|nr:glycosyltransferase [Candidatus Formimonas warabiya]ATW25509.1 glycosyl transferase [Candidatus Formimonas warabiya]
MFIAQQTKPNEQEKETIFPGKIMFISVHGSPLAKLGGIQSGGQNVYVRELVKALDQLGVTVDVFTHWTDISQPQITPMGKKSRVIRLAAGSPGFRPKHEMAGNLPKFLKELKQYMTSPYSYTLIHSNYWLSGWVGLNLRRSSRMKLIHTSHSLGAVRKGALIKTPDPSMTNRLNIEKELFQTADRVIATSPSEKAVLSNYYTVPSKKIKVVPCGINAGIFHPDNQKSKPDHLPLKKRMILFVGRFEENKGLNILLQSLVILQNKFPLTAASTCLTVVGGDELNLLPHQISPEKQRYLDFIKAKGLTDLVKFIGPISHEDLVTYYRNASITIIPSFYESFGLVAVEAMASGCPVIASRTGGLADNVINGKTGFLVKPKDPEELAGAINKLLTDEQLRRHMKKEASIHGRQFSWLDIAWNMLSIYKEVIGCQTTTLNGIPDIS